MSIRTKALSDITWPDIVDLATIGATEDAMLEFKGLLPEKNGKRHGWYDGRDQITDYTRDKLAAEIVGLANAYGGRLIIGIKETQDRPRKTAGVEPLPRCEIFAEQLEQAFHSIVDPPIGSFQITPIVDPAAVDSAGAVIIAVSASDLAPHGIGRPPAAYIRRGTSCEEMTMRDIQSVFWDARTKRERVEALRKKESADLAKLFHERMAQHQHSIATIDLQAPAEPGVFLRVTAIAHSSLGLNQTGLAQFINQLRPIRDDHGSDWRPLFGDGQPVNFWRLRAHGMQAFERGPSRWTILDDGTISVIGFSAGYRSRHVVNGHFPGAFALVAAQVLVMSDCLRRKVGRPDIPIEIDIEMRHDGSASGIEWQTVTKLFSGFANRHAEIGPVIFRARAEAEAIFRELETQCWSAFGLRASRTADVDFERWFSERN
ncbi:AlbA family DNA-binding domain-containing protein [Bosea vaviloviae]|uniref:Schlafen AlbA-2 domain-containing protein n=1 Tax=Bosea vaviloviae TaxID=1526658 RepID=A0A1D7U4T8_9HYPH|nr:ATP-binding protein [Bosea vaviloviae]AOO82395.1 hypothetical protein BHK69_19860 [Bosea vaviloviae]